jgi:hypothetical protein
MGVTEDKQWATEEVVELLSGARLGWRQSMGVAKDGTGGWCKGDGAEGTRIQWDEEEDDSVVGCFIWTITKATSVRTLRGLGGTWREQNNVACGDVIR